MIITAHKDWFAAFDHDNIDHLFGESRQDQFEQAAVAWLKDSFGDDVILARADLDETTYRIHAVVLPRSQTKDGRKMLQPSVHALIKDYEKAQDSVGEWFSELGLQRGERRKQALRDAVHQHRNDQTSSANENEGLASLPEHVEHVSPRKWREEKEWQLTEREAHVGKREKQAATEDDAFRRKVFVLFEAVAKIGAKKKIQRHPLRPAGIDQEVEKLRGVKKEQAEGDGKTRSGTQGVSG